MWPWIAYLVPPRFRTPLTRVGLVACRGSAADRRVGSLIGEALGDALGFLVEGQHPVLCERFAIAAFAADDPPEGFGQYSDDTQLARELGCSLVERGAWVPGDYAKRIADIFETSRIVGRGQATAAAAKRLGAGVGWDEAGEPTPSAGNGAAMRVAPVGFTFGEAAMRRRIADEQARITHRDERSRAAAVLVGEVVADAMRRPHAAPRGHAVEVVGTQDWCSSLAAAVRAQDPELAAAVERIPVWIAGPSEVAAQEIAKAGSAPLGSAHQFQKWHGISPFATPSAVYAVYAYAASPLDAEKVLRTSVAVGGDVDTVAAMAGAMVGARVGWFGLSPRLRRWARGLHDQGEFGLVALAELAAACGRVATHR